MDQETSVETQEVANPVENLSQEDVQATNWRETRELLKEQKAALDRLEREKAEMAAMLQQAFNKPPQEEDEDEPIDPYSENFGKQLEKKMSRAVEKAHDRIEQKKRNDPAFLEEQARKRYSDFDSVMTAENIDTIIKSNPLVHKAVMASGAPIEAAYELIKGSAVYQSRASKNGSTARIVAEERQKLAENAAKPKSTNSIPRSQTISAVSGFGRLSKAQAAEIHAETLRIKRGR